MRPKVSRRSLEDQANAKYYSVPHRGDTNYSAVPVSKQRSLEGEQFKNFVQQVPPVIQHPSQSHYQGHPQVMEPSGTSSISRSVSFMGGRQTRPQPPLETSSTLTSASTTSNSFGTSSSWRASFDSGGRRSVESTPQSSRRQQQPQIYSTSSMKSPSDKSGPRTRALPPTPTSNPVESQSGQNIDGYCTPMINRKVSTSVDRSDSGISSGGQVKAKPQPKPRSSVNNHSSPPALKPSSQQQQQLIHHQLQQQLKESSHLSISQLVDSGMSALRDGNGNDDNEEEEIDVKGNNNHKKFRRKDSSKMSPLQMYILEQAKLSGYRLRGGDTLNGDRDSYVESEDDRGRESDDFADDEVSLKLKNALSSIVSKRVWCESNLRLKIPIYLPFTYIQVYFSTLLVHFLKNGPNPASFFVYFRSFHLTNIA